MTASTTIKRQPENLRPITGSDPLSALMLTQAQVWLRGQQAFLDAIEGYMDEWIARRRSDVEASLDTLQRLSATPDPAEQMAIWRSWMDGHLERMRRDLTDLAAQAAYLSRTISARAAEASPPRSGGPGRAGASGRTGGAGKPGAAS